MKQTVLLSVLALLALTGCSRDEPAPPPAATIPPMSESIFPVERVARGARIFQQNCAECHGPDAQGHPDWQNPQIAVAPPLDGQGHAHQRTQQQLVMIIKQGARRDGKDVMPAWKERLSDEEIADVVIWFQALWPVDVYKQWQKANSSSQTPRG